jgi:hypothetical protein
LEASAILAVQGLRAHAELRRCEYPAFGPFERRRTTTVLEVIGAGYGRTGTLSLKTALA